MLVLTRRIGEEIVLPDSEVAVAVLSVTGKRVKLGVTAPAGVAVHRREILQRVRGTDEHGAALRRRPSDLV